MEKVKKFDYNICGKYINELDADIIPIHESLYYFVSKLEPLDEDDDEDYIFFDDELFNELDSAKLDEADDFMEKVQRFEKIFWEHYNVIDYYQ